MECWDSHEARFFRQLLPCSNDTLVGGFSPTRLKNITVVKMVSSSPIFGVKIKTI